MTTIGVRPVDHAHEPDGERAAGRAREDLLLFRALEDPGRRLAATRLLDDGMGARRWRPSGEDDLWELHDATCRSGKDPVAAAATRPIGDGRRVRLVALVVAAAGRGRGIGRRMIEELTDALRRRGVLTIVAAVPSDDAAAIVVMQRAGLRPSHVERSSPEAGGHDLVWFDLEL